ncbi:Fucoxanthin-chlorophyll a-c binding protein [Seminavis robusta]|uniref:Fucoxanthin-chlorophyll a-c binding protein n=1 Tax=Seminavis robusta TaxID=568900 RepID=A0A9N8EMS2_9STRA|nr:Fucoxanthin-chlorophyll a-c binding protein [Seminavis robusta]CAB9524647.1 Fucoxanthin-chlorophyll a-c binding protein [Seminavis robusta]|eukprot:Sro1564_g282740.1 Fucoxanthin-chlorophyll a-c binding protein (200) ;mRNA; r:1733-2332
MKTAILACLVSGAVAFAPAAKPSTGSALAANKYASEIGAQVPLGFFDPFGVLGAEDDTLFNFLRYAEIKHGRVAMMGVVGYLTTYAGVRAPGHEDVPCGLAALKPENWGSELVTTNMCWTLGFIAFLEWFVMKQGDDAAFPGDLSNGVGADIWNGYDEATKLRKRSIELNNGRAAQMGIFGLVVHETMGNVNVLLPLAK